MTKIRITCEAPAEGSNLATFRFEGGAGEVRPGGVGDRAKAYGFPNAVLDEVERRAKSLSTGQSFDLLRLGCTCRTSYVAFGAISSGVVTNPGFRCVTEGCGQLRLPTYAIEQVWVLDRKVWKLMSGTR
ncbi:MAG: hypothetical protein WAU32_15045 [Thermoanaerobaculia bacterium]